MVEGRSPARSVAKLLFELLMSERKRVIAVAAELDLPLMQVATILRLGLDGEGGGVPMSQLAEHCGCDPSNITGIVDKLEARRVIRREAAPGDRRVKRIVLTTEGKRLHQRITERLQEPPEWVLRLPVDDQKRLRDILERGLRT